MAFFKNVFLLFFFCSSVGRWGRGGRRGGVKDESRSMPREVVCGSVSPKAQPLSTWRQPASARLCFWPCCCLPVCFVLTSSGLTGPGRPSDRHPHVFVRSLGCDLCLEWTEPLAPQKSCLLGEK